MRVSMYKFMCSQYTLVQISCFTYLLQIKKLTTRVKNENKECMGRKIPKRCATAGQ